MASREMIDVLDRLRDLDKVNPNVHSDALENTEKLNPPVEEAKKKMVKDPKTGKMVPSYAIVFAFTIDSITWNHFTIDSITW